MDNERASNVAALTQAGYAVGLAFLCPVADMVPRRPMILFLIAATATIVSSSNLAWRVREMTLASQAYR